MKIQPSRYTGKVFRQGKKGACWQGGQAQNLMMMKSVCNVHSRCMCIWQRNKILCATKKTEHSEQEKNLRYCTYSQHTQYRNNYLTLHKQQQQQFAEYWNNNMGRSNSNSQAQLH
eukprot:scpid43515/ scgid20925/ 